MWSPVTAKPTSNDKENFVASTGRTVVEIPVLLNYDDVDMTLAYSGSSCGFGFQCGYNSTRGTLIPSRLAKTCQACYFVLDFRMARIVHRYTILPPEAQFRPIA